MANKEARYDAADKRVIAGATFTNEFYGEGKRFDSAEDAGIFFAQELDHVKAKTYDKQYPEMTALATFPITHEVPAGAESTTYYSYEKTGMAQIISNYSTDLPRADVKGDPTTAHIRSVGDSYGYSVQDMRASTMVGKQLDSRRAESARYAADNTINKIAWAGDAKHNLMGLLTVSNNIPVYALAQTQKDGKTEFTEKECDEILADFSGIIEQIAKNTKNVEKPDTVWMAPSRMRFLSMKRIEGTNGTVLGFLKENLSQIVNWNEAPELEADAVDTNPYANAQGTGKAVMVIGNCSEEKFSLENPMEFTQYTAQEKGLEIVVPCEARTAGIIIYYPLSLEIVPGI